MAININKVLHAVEAPKRESFLETGYLQFHEDDDPTTSATTSTEKTAETDDGNTSASASKIDLSFYENLVEDENNTDTSNMYMFMDIQVLSDLIQLVGVCPECQTQLVIFMDSSGKKRSCTKVNT